MIKRIIGYTLVVLGFVIFCFFRRYTRDSIPYSIVIFIVGAAILLIGAFIIFKGVSLKEQEPSKQFKKSIADLKENGEKIQVDLLKCGIKENDYSIERRDRMASRYDIDIKVKQVEMNQTILIFLHNHENIEEKFISPVIPRTGDDLRIKLYLTKTTYLYVDKNDRTKYYFDLDFLNAT